jgi:hypothetical protein
MREEVVSRYLGLSEYASINRTEVSTRCTCFVDYLRMFTACMPRQAVAAGRWSNSIHCPAVFILYIGNLVPNTQLTKGQASLRPEGSTCCMCFVEYLRMFTACMPR